MSPTEQQQPKYDLVIDASPGETEAILKCQQRIIRRPVTPIPIGRYMTKGKYKPGDIVVRYASQAKAWPYRITSPTKSEHMECPFGWPGQIIAFREAWAAIEQNTIIYRADNHRRHFKLQAQSEMARYIKSLWAIQPPGEWRSPDTMPEIAIRIHRQITHVSCQNLWKISEQEAAQEHGLILQTLRDPPADIARPYRALFAQTWDAQQIAAEFRWAANPWVWVIRFEPKEIS